MRTALTFQSPGTDVGAVRIDSADRQPVFRFVENLGQTPLITELPPRSSPLAFVLQNRSGEGATPLVTLTLEVRNGDDILSTENVTNGATRVIPIPLAATEIRIINQSLINSCAMVATLF